MAGVYSLHSSHTKPNCAIERNAYRSVGFRFTGFVWIIGLTGFCTLFRARSSLMLGVIKGIKMQDILAINSHLKYVEYLLYLFDNESDDITLREIKNKFQDKFKTNHALLNQNFGVYRLLPLILMKEEYKNQRQELSGDIKKIKIIRDAIVHHNFSIDENGYEFKNDKDTVSFSYKEFTDFLYKIENKFYSKNINNR